MNLFSIFCILMILFATISYTYGHSWLHCSDYDGTISGQDYDEDKCNGYIRQWSSVWGATSFATDRGVNYQASSSDWCQSDFSSDIEGMYDSGYPYAEWHWGQTITLVWPAKNHANYDCFNYIPDSSMRLLYNSQVNPTTELTGSVDSVWDELIDWHDGCTPGTDGCGFQNCPDFCENTDGAPCFGEYTVSSNHFPNEGFYTLMWYWIFNGGTTAYTTCFEVYVHAVDGETDTTGDDDDDDDDDTTTGTTDTETNTDTDTETTDGTTNTGDDDSTTNTGDDDDSTTNTGNTGNAGGDDDTTDTSNTGDDDDTTTNTNTGGDDDDEDDDDDDDDDDDSTTGTAGSNEVFDYIVTIPICYEGADYDEDSVIDGANNAFNSNDDVSFTIVSGTLFSNANGFNVSIQAHTSNAGDVTSAAYDYSNNGDSDICDEIEDEFNNVGSCEICNPGSIRLYSLNSANTDSGSSNNGNSNSFVNDILDGLSPIIIAVVSLIVVIILLTICIAYYKCKEKKQSIENGTAAHQGARSPQFGQTQTAQANITYAN